jgi:hypothetical protein
MAVFKFSPIMRNGDEAMISVHPISIGGVAHTRRRSGLVLSAYAISAKNAVAPMILCGLVGTVGIIGGNFWALHGY